MASCKASVLGTGAFCPSLVLQHRLPGAAGARSTSQRMVANTRTRRTVGGTAPEAALCILAQCSLAFQCSPLPIPLALRTKPGAENSGTVAFQTRELRLGTVKREGATQVPGWRRGGSRSAAPLAEAQRWVRARRPGPRPTRSARSPLIKRLDPGKPPGRAVIR